MSEIDDLLFEALANEQRRRILFSLVEHHAPVNLDSPPDALSDGGTRSIEQHHVHLPKLADCGFIEWSPNGDAVERGTHFEEIRPLLELLTDHRERFPATQE